MRMIMAMRRIMVTKMIRISMMMCMIMVSL